jgi:hypothetical protein
MAAVGPASEWSWFDYLSPGDVLRLVRLRQIIDAPDASADVATAAAMAFAEIGRVAQERLAKARVSTSDAPVDPIVLAARAKVLELRKLYESGDSDYCAGVKETCDAIGEVLGMGTTDQIAENDPANASKRVAIITELIARGDYRGPATIEALAKAWGLDASTVRGYAERALKALL